MRYFCVDTSNGASVCVVDFDGHTLNILAEENMYDSQMHGEYLGVMLKDIFSELGVENACELGIDRVVCGVGPAPFTGLRAGLVTSRVLAFSCDAKLCGVCSLDAMALQGFDFYRQLGREKAVVEKLFVATDARRKEIYYGLYEAVGENDVKVVDRVGVDKPESVSKFLLENLDSSYKNIGLGCVKYNEFFNVDDDIPLYVKAGNLARIAYYREKCGIDIEDTSPMYLRRPDVQENSVRKVVLN